MPSTCFRIQQKRIKVPASPRNQGSYDPYSYYAVIRLNLLIGDPPTPIGYPFHLDTGGDISIIPVSWFATNLTQIGPLSIETCANTTAGDKTARGRMAKIAVQFPDIEKEIRLDFLVSSTFEKEFGLLSLRDVLNNFNFRTTGPFLGQSSIGPIALGFLELTARDS